MGLKVIQLLKTRPENGGSDRLKDSDVMPVFDSIMKEQQAFGSPLELLSDAAMACPRTEVGCEV